MNCNFKFDISKYDRKYLYSLNTLDWFKLLDRRENFFTMLEEGVDFSNWIIFKNLLKEPVSLIFDDETNYKSYYALSKWEKAFNTKSSNNSIQPFSTFDIKSFCNLPYNRDIIKGMVDNGVIFKIFGDEGEIKDIYKEGTFYSPHYEQGIRYFKVDTNYPRQKIINDFIGYLDNMLETTDRKRNNKHGFTDRYKNKLISYKVLPILDLIIFREVFNLELKDIDIYDIVFTEPEEAINKGREAKALALQVISEKNMLWLASLL
ncbi:MULTISPECIES: hypothetical protein [Francisella]|uniref:hypothetical protein n=1 Tax=Francisella TaxID=262 RepID=UPI0011B42853|nr:MULTISPECIES: hypothetical protein [Francisella]